MEQRKLSYIAHPSVNANTTMENITSATINSLQMNLHTYTPEQMQNNQSSNVCNHQKLLIIQRFVNIKKETGMVFIKKNNVV